MFVDFLKVVFERFVMFFVFFRRGRKSQAASDVFFKRRVTPNREPTVFWEVFFSFLPDEFLILVTYGHLFEEICFFDHHYDCPHFFGVSL